MNQFTSDGVRYVLQFDHNRKTRSVRAITNCGLAMVGQDGQARILAFGNGICDLTDQFHRLRGRECALRDMLESGLFRWEKMFSVRAMLQEELDLLSKRLAAKGERPPRGEKKPAPTLAEIEQLQAGIAKKRWARIIAAVDGVKRLRLAEEERVARLRRRARKLGMGS